MLKIVLVRDEGLCCVERRVGVDQLDMTNVFVSQFRHSGERLEHVARLAKDQQVIVLRFKISAI